MTVDVNYFWDFEESKISGRYSNLLQIAFGPANILFVDYIDDYSGHVRFLGYQEKYNRFVYYEYYYGSCSGCDTWEARKLDNFEIVTEMRHDAIFLTREECFKYIENALIPNYTNQDDYDYDPIAEKKIKGLISLIEDLISE